MATSFTYMKHDQRLTREIGTINNLFFVWEKYTAMPRGATLHFAFSISAIGWLGSAKTCVYVYDYERPLLFPFPSLYCRRQRVKLTSLEVKLKAWNGSKIFFDVFDYFVAIFLESTMRPEWWLWFSMVDINCRTYFSPSLVSPCAMWAMLPHTFGIWKLEIHDNVINGPIFHSFGPHRVIKWQIKRDEMRLRRPFSSLRAKLLLLSNQDIKKKLTV